MLFMALAVAGSALAVPPTGDEPVKYRLDMVHHIPGAARYETKYEDPAVIAEMGYNGTIYCPV